MNHSVSNTNITHALIKHVSHQGSFNIRSRFLISLLTFYMEQRSLPPQLFLIEIEAITFENKPVLPVYTSPCYNNINKGLMLLVTNTKSYHCNCEGFKLEILPFVFMVYFTIQKETGTGPRMALEIIYVVTLKTRESIFMLITQSVMDIHVPIPPSQARRSWDIEV